MLISAVQPFTLLDYPGKIACIAFTPGCNFRCGFCHNAEFVIPEQIQKIRKSFITEAAFFSFLEERRGLLDGVVITGGEPTIFQDLPRFMRKVKESGFLVKLDSNGTNPEMLEQAFKDNLVDCVAMDIKSDFDHYHEIAGKKIDVENIKKSIALVMKSGVDHEFRSTLVRELHTPEILKNMAESVKGAMAFSVQQFRPGKTLDPEFQSYTAFTEQEMHEIANDVFAPHVGKTDVRM